MSEPRRWWVRPPHGSLPFGACVDEETLGGIAVIEACAYAALKERVEELEKENAELKSALEYHGDDYVKQVGTWKIVQRLEEERDELKAQLAEAVSLLKLLYGDYHSPDCMEITENDCDCGFTKAQLFLNKLKSGGGEHE